MAFEVKMTNILQWNSMQAVKDLWMRNFDFSKKTKRLWPSQQR